MDQNFSKADISIESTGTGRGGDVGSHNETATNSGWMQSAKDILSSITGNGNTGNTINYNAGSQTTNTTSHSVNDNSVKNDNSSSSQNNYFNSSELTTKQTPALSVCPTLPVSPSEFGTEPFHSDPNSRQVGANEPGFEACGKSSCHVSSNPRQEERFSPTKIGAPSQVIQNDRIPSVAAARAKNAIPIQHQLPEKAQQGQESQQRLNGSSGGNSTFASSTLEKDVKADAALLNYLNSPEAKHVIQTAMNDLKDVAFLVELEFRNVSRGLSAAVQVNETCRVGLDPFRASWTKLHKQYIHLLWKSRISAGDARVTAKDFATDFIDILKDDTVSLAEKRDEIHAYQDNLKSDAHQSRELTQGFLNLQSNVASFQTAITKWMNENGIEQLQGTITQILRDIGKTHENMKRSTSQILTGTIGSVALGGYAAGLCAVGIIGPSLFLGAAVSGFYAFTSAEDLLGQLKVKNACEKELKEKMRELRGKEGTSNGLNRTEPVLEPLKVDMEFLREKLSVFAEIKNMIIADLLILERKLDLAYVEKGMVPLKKRLNTVSAVYRLLDDALYQYETSIHTESFTKQISYERH
ncbi:hypothetical protein K435DRAFT_865460 [Dendrothele bispora CBS 962.96]|uniref:Uncharacterized protein n=1 Tax=Dendrothele bispora (strain CBS 962.96) TaxID=1314807 RepID=A0A4S8LJF3_DENBC|nr:hypothetical protein K435DRAFT_865460 [Dendrothele bispora CBS 962.96]